MKFSLGDVVVADTDPIEAAANGIDNGTQYIIIGYFDRSNCVLFLRDDGLSQCYEHRFKLVAPNHKKVDNKTTE
jgi:hypothetical protein